MPAGAATRPVLDGLETGKSEVLADQAARQARAALDRSVDERYAAFAPTH